jgi:hypothetical protein
VATHGIEPNGHAIEGQRLDARLALGGVITVDVVGAKPMRRVVSR